MAKVKEAVDMRMASNIVADASNGTKVEYEQVPLDDTDNWSDTLKKEIAFFTSSESLDTVEIDINDIKPAQIIKHFKTYFADGEKVKNFYYVKEDDLEENKYIYDKANDIVYKIPKTHISIHTVHSVEYLDYLQSGVKKENVPINYTLITQSEVSLKQVGNVKCYEPDLNNLAEETTKLVFYKLDENTVTNTKKEMSVTEWLNYKNADGTANPKPNEILEGTDKYVLYDYENKIWANIKVLNTKGTEDTKDDIETWWVWIPRCAYCNTTTNENGSKQGTTDILFINIENMLASDETTQLPETHSVAKVFDGNTRKGMWVSKYEHTSKSTTNTSEWAYYIPDVKGLDKNSTELAIYNDGATSFVEYKKLSEVTNLASFAKTNNWFDYYNQKWANIKITKNGAELWWVWIPRYAYCNTGNTTDIIFIDVDNEPMDGSELPPSYKIPKAFEGNTKKGVWVNKYEFTSKTTTVPEDIAIVPDLTGLTGPNIKVYLETYDDSKTGFNSSPTEYTPGMNLEQFARDNNWYDYANQAWANIKIINTKGTPETTDDIETWWVWIPRYAYKNTGTVTEIVLIGTDNKDLRGNALPEGYKVQKSFEGNTKKGAWVNKYEFTIKE